MKKILSLFILLLSSMVSLAQNTTETEMADTLYANGKIYLVVAVVIIIFTGIIFFLVRIDRQVRKLEKQVQDKN